ncbi:MAG: energy transducer TonB [Myxococcota bacterium]
MSQQRVGYAALLASLGVHVGIAQSRPARDIPQRVKRAPVELSITPIQAPEPKPQPALPAPLPPPEQSKSKPPPRVSQPRIRETPAPASHEPPPPELTGKTLVSDHGSAWSAPEGNGNAREGTVASASTARTPPAPLVAPVAARAPEPSVQPLSQLSRVPAPPSLSDLLAKNYPPLYRNQGQSGEAKVRALIEPNGRVSRTEVKAESAAGFGDACQKALLQSRWTGPLGSDGKPVATWITYRCKFRIDR